MAETKRTSLKLLIDSKANKVVFAEADKAFVDFICDILSMPMNSIVKLLNKDKDKEGMVGSLGNVYKSIEALGNEHFLPNINKDWVLTPTTTIRVPLLSLFDAPANQRLELHVCYKSLHFTDVPNVGCPCLHSRYQCHMSPSEMDYVAPAASVSVDRMVREGYVKGVVKYMVMDSLEIKPLSMALIKSHIKDIASLIEKDVDVGPDEGVAILKASLESQAVLTAVFLGKSLIKTEK